MRKHAYSASLSARAGEPVSFKSGIVAMPAVDASAPRIGETLVSAYDHNPHFRIAADSIWTSRSLPANGPASTRVLQRLAFFTGEPSAIFVSPYANDGSGPEVASDSHGRVYWTALENQRSFIRCKSPDPAAPLQSIPIEGYHGVRHMRVLGERLYFQDDSGFRFYDIAAQSLTSLSTEIEFCNDERSFSLVDGAHYWQIWDFASDTKRIIQHTTASIDTGIAHPAGNDALRFLGVAHGKVYYTCDDRQDTAVVARDLANPAADFVTVFIGNPLADQGMPTDPYFEDGTLYFLAHDGRFRAASFAKVDLLTGVFTALSPAPKSARAVAFQMPYFYFTDSAVGLGCAQGARRLARLAVA